MNTIIDLGKKRLIMPKFRVKAVTLFRTNNGKGNNNKKHKHRNNVLTF